MTDKFNGSMLVTSLRSSYSRHAQLMYDCGEENITTFTSMDTIAICRVIVSFVYNVCGVLTYGTSSEKQETV